MTHARRTCIESTHGCASFHPGHCVHPIHANQVGKRPWGWRDGVVTQVAGGEVRVEYVVADGRARLWHHIDLGGRMAVGSLVRVHEELHVLGGPFGWLNVELVEGVGPVHTPCDPSAWTAEMQVAVTDMVTGQAVAMDHKSGPSRWNHPLPRGVV